MYDGNGGGCQGYSFVLPMTHTQAQPLPLSLSSQRYDATPTLCFVCQVHRSDLPPSATRTPTHCPIPDIALHHGVLRL